MRGFALLRLLRGWLCGCVVLPLCDLFCYCIARNRVADCPASDRHRSLAQRCGLRCRLVGRSSCRWVCLAGLLPGCVCTQGCCVLYPLLPRRKRLALVLLLLLSHVGFVLCVGLLSVCHLVCDARQSDVALPIGLPQSDYLAHHSIMFTSRPNAWHIAFCVAGFVRAGLTALPQIIQPPCDRLRSMQLANCVSFTSYQT